MTKPIPYIMQGKNVILAINNKPYTINEAHISYDKIVLAIKSKQWDLIPSLVDATKAINQYVQGNFELKNGVFYRNGEPIHGVVGERVVQMYQDGFDVNPILNFINNVEQNPSSRAVTELYGFLEKSNLPLTDDGYFLAYKRVRADYLDVYSGTVLNKPVDKMTTVELAQYGVAGGVTNAGVTVGIDSGETVVSMLRNKVDDVAERTCSYGLHFCSIDYLPHFGGDKIVVLKIHPKDVVSIPVDYNNAKGRCSEYRVVGEVEDTSKPEKAFKSSVDNSYNKKTVVNTSTNGTAKHPLPYRKNVRGQWIDGRGSFLPKALIPV